MRRNLADAEADIARQQTRIAELKRERARLRRALSELLGDNDKECDGPYRHAEPADAELRAVRDALSIGDDDARTTLEMAEDAAKRVRALQAVLSEADTALQDNADDLGLQPPLTISAINKVVAMAASYVRLRDRLYRLAQACRVVNRARDEQQPYTVTAEDRLMNLIEEFLPLHRAQLRRDADAADAEQQGVQFALLRLLDTLPPSVTEVTVAGDEGMYYMKGFNGAWLYNYRNTGISSSLCNARHIVSKLMADGRPGFSVLVSEKKK